MKKIVIFLVMALFLAVPFAASADPIALGTGNLFATSSDPKWGDFNTDYEGTVTGANFSYSITNEQIFCVSREPLSGSGQTYYFYNINTDLANYEAMSKAAWVAEKYWKSDDTTIGEAQKAIWEITGVFTTSADDGLAATILASAIGAPLAEIEAASANWLYAINPDYILQRRGEVLGFQDFLTPNHPTVPEPSLLLLLGFGLFGLGMTSRKLKK